MIYYKVITKKHIKHTCNVQIWNMSRKRCDFMAGNVIAIYVNKELYLLSELKLQNMKYILKITDDMGLRFNWDSLVWKLDIYILFSNLLTFKAISHQLINHTLNIE